MFIQKSFRFREGRFESNVTLLATAIVVFGIDTKSSHVSLLTCPLRQFVYRVSGLAVQGTTENFHEEVWIKE